MFRKGAVREFYSQLGPGLISGAADDDPSGIATYSVAGAAFGYTTLWTALFSFPLMAAVQLMAARLGLVSGQGFAAIIRRRYPGWVLWGACLLLTVANVINIGADLGGMAAASELVTGMDSLWWIPFYVLLLLVLLFWTSYRTIARVFKWLTLVLFAYIVAAFLARPDWGQVLRATVVPKIQWSKSYLSVLVAILGTSISPYLFFWQAAEEVEEERAQGRRSVASRRGATADELRRSRIDVGTGMFFSNFVMYFIILTASSTLHAHGETRIATARDAAEALRPLAGNGAYWLYTLGLIGTGMLGVPVLAGSSAYAIAEAFAWRRASLEDKPRMAGKFYGVLGVALVVGMALDTLRLDSVKLLFWSAVINGVLAPPLIILLVLLTSDGSVMGRHVNSKWIAALGWITAAVMSGCAAAMFLAR